MASSGDKTKRPSARRGERSERVQAAPSIGPGTSESPAIPDTAARPPIPSAEQTSASAHLHQGSDSRISGGASRVGARPSSRSKSRKAARARTSSKPLSTSANAEKSSSAHVSTRAGGSEGRATKRDERRQNSRRARDRRIPPNEGAVLVTGICGRMGRLLARRLHRSEEVIGIDRRPFLGKPKDIVHHQIDVRRKKTRDIFRAGGIRAVVHLGVLHNPRATEKDRHSWNIVAFQKLLGYMEAYDVPKLVVLSSANVYGPQPDNPQFLEEEAPLLGAQRFLGIRDLVELDMLAQSFFWKHPETETVILRPCHILGRVRNAASNYLRLERPLSLMGFDPMVQPIHERDVVRAIEMALRPGVRGIFNLRGPGELPLSRIFERLGRKPRPIPKTIAKAALSRLWRYRMTSFPPPELDHIRFVCMVDDSRARDVMGFRPEHDMDATLRAVTSER